MRIAVIGPGISGNVCVRRLSPEHDVHLFETNDYWGYGFHEDGVSSTLDVCKHFAIDLDRLAARPCQSERCVKAVQPK
jgi:predicted NAD/FAD-binding protein